MSSKAGLIDRVRPWLLKKVIESTDRHVVPFQKLCGVTFAKDGKTPVPGYLPLHLIFSFGASLGNELFYLAFLPSVFWNLDVVLGRRLVLFWVWLYYIGQMIKDVLKLPRPPSPPAMRLEHHYAEEYGLPSTHAMVAVSFPFFLAYQTHKDLGWDAWVVGPIAVCWCLSMLLSRLYMGVHSFPDLIAGVSLGLPTLAFGLWIGDSLDTWLLTSENAHWIIPSIIMAAVITYPRPSKWTNTYGDTALILSTYMGVALGARMMAPHYALTEAISKGSALTTHLSTSSPVFVSLSMGWSGASLTGWALPIEYKFLGMIIRTVVGFMMMVTTRQVFKSLVTALVLRVVPTSKVDAKFRYEVEIPTKVATYSAIGFNAVFTYPYCVAYMGF